jgi:hypothetical protein
VCGVGSGIGRCVCVSRCVALDFVMCVGLVLTVLLYELFFK